MSAMTNFLIHCQVQPIFDNYVQIKNNNNNGKEK